jgi:flagellar hook protein FlgE
MNSTFYTALAGMKTYQQGIDVWSHNLSNANLAGFKAKRPEFSTLFTASMTNLPSLGTVGSEKGYGSKLNIAPITRDQGSLKTTESTFDLAINGNGWFGVLNEDNTIVYTRNGSFNFDAERYLVDKRGSYLTGQMAGNMQISPDATKNKLLGVVTDINVGSPETQSKIQLPNMLTYPKKYTNKVSLSGNLGVTNGNQTFSTNLVSATEEKNIITINLTKSANQPDVGSAWNVTATITNLDGSIIYDKKNGNITFGGLGEVLNYDMPQLSNDGLPINLDFGHEMVGLQANDSAPESVAIAKNGEPEGNLDHYAVSQDGNVVAFFDNGYKTVVAKVAVFHFRNEQGLQDIGGSYYMANDISGKSVFYRDATGDVITTSGLIFDHHLEETNIDNSEALSELMIIQKAYDANASALKAGDDMIRKALNMDA